MDKKEFSPIEIDAIGEISNICLGILRLHKYAAT